MQHNETEELISSLIKKVKEIPREEFLSMTPSPLFLPNKSSIGGISKSVGPNSMSKVAPQTPPRNLRDLCIQSN